MLPLSDDALEEIWKRNDVDRINSRHALHTPFTQPMIDRRILLQEVARLRELTTRLDLDLVDCQGRLQDAQEERLPL